MVCCSRWRSVRGNSTAPSSLHQLRSERGSPDIIAQRPPACNQWLTELAVAAAFEILQLPFGFFLRHAVSLLQFAEQSFSVAIHHSQIVIRQLAPLSFYL